MTTHWQSRFTSNEIKYQSADQFVANPDNPREHPGEQREGLIGSLDTLGWVAPVIVNARNGYVLDGHARIEEALTANDQQQIPFVEVDLDDAEEAQFLATFDWITTLARYNRDRVEAVMQRVQSDNERVQEMIARQAEALGVVLGESQVVDDPGAQIDRAEELQREWGTERGQLWIIPSAHGGEHRLLCGDSTSDADVARLGEFETVITDIPYGISQKTNGLRELDYGEWDKGDVLGLSRKALGYCLSAHTITAFCGDDQLSYLWRDMQADNRTCRTVAWVKPNPTVLNGQHVFLPGLEVAAHGRRSGAWFSGHCVSSVWRGTPDSDRLHPTQKPIELFAWLVNLTCPKNGVIYDPFGGSGTTMVACEQLTRQCRMMEIEPKYVAVILQRMSDMGLEPRLTDATPD